VETAHTSQVGPLTLFNLAEFTDKRRENPCVAAFGAGPVGVTCKGCAHLYRHTPPGNKTFLKCGLRRFSHGSATDHKAGWPVCAKFRPVPTSVGATGNEPKDFGKGKSSLGPRVGSASVSSSRVVKVQAVKVGRGSVEEPGPAPTKTKVTIV
jgi:hypothetical protein